MNEHKKAHRTSENILQALKNGIRAGIPIGLGYFAVSFSLGIAARNAGLTPFQSFLASMLCNASAGEYAGFTTIAANATYLEIAIITIVANLRYLLMSCAMSQRLRPGFPLLHRLLMGFYLTDELFGIAISRPGFLDPYYTYGAVLVAGPAWGIGTALGNIAGNLLPDRLVSALSVALYGMFLAIIIPPSRKNKIIAGVVSISFAASLAASCLPYISALSQGTRTIILTLLISAGAAFLFPIPQSTDEEESK
ncbi:MAG: AzlC family ABC transporter permease [Acetatifactor sp.]|nr:AzlC family ABC transporter permease [Acetatifactor sp.]